MKTAKQVLYSLVAIAVLIVSQVSCKSAAQYDIRGTWNAILSFFDGTSDAFSFTFTGTEESGVVTHTGLAYPGTYTVNGDQAEFSIEYVILYTRSTESYNAGFNSEDTMSGDFEWDTDIIFFNSPPLVWAWGSFIATRQ